MSNNPARRQEENLLAPNRLRDTAFLSPSALGREQAAHSPLPERWQKVRFPCCGGAGPLAAARLSPFARTQEDPTRRGREEGAIRLLLGEPA